MKTTKFTEDQIAFALRQAETGTKVAEVCRKMGISDAIFHNCKKKYEGLGISELGASSSLRRRTGNSRSSWQI